uniref:Uncharacterized protein n=1 Tax=Romanomermis culicivorax TaxID=13658 RepID=A0A915KCD4_ROMCU
MLKDRSISIIHEELFNNIMLKAKRFEFSLNLLFSRKEGLLIRNDPKQEPTALEIVYKEHLL